MTGKEALEELKFQVGNITYYTHDLQSATFKVRDSGLFEIIEKELTRLEDIEQELGIDLITLFKALKQFYAKDKDCYCPNPISLFRSWEGVWQLEFMWNYYNLKDYGKTWALTREELEK